MGAWTCSRMVFRSWSSLAGTKADCGQRICSLGQVVAFSADGAARVVITVPEVLAGFGWMPDGSLLVVTRGGRVLRQQAGPAVEVPSLLSGGPVPCNEMTVDGQGRASIGLFGLAGGGLARVDPDG